MSRETETDEILSSIVEHAKSGGQPASEETLTELTGVVPAPPFRDRMTVVDKVYHQPRAGEAFCCEVTFERHLTDEESVYSRKIRVNFEWKQLYLGWFTDDEKPVGMLVIRNDEGKYLQTIPSPEEKAEIASRVLEVGVFDVPLFLVPPGESLRAVPAGQDLYVRCLGGECSVTVFAFPK